MKKTVSLKPKGAERSSSALAATHAPRAIRARLFAAEQKRELKKKSSSSNKASNAAASAAAANDFFAAEKLQQQRAPEKIKKGNHTFTGPEFGLRFREPEDAVAAAAAAAEGELVAAARAEAAQAARATTSRRLGKAEVPTRQKRRDGGIEMTGGGNAGARATRTLFQPQAR